MISNIVLKETLATKGQELFTRTKETVNKIEKSLIDRRNEKGVITKLDEIRFMKSIGLAKSKEDLVSLNKFLADRNYEGMIKLPDFGLTTKELLVVYKTVVEEGSLYKKTKHNSLEVLQRVDLKVIRTKDKFGNKDSEVVIDSKRIINYSNIVDFYISL